MEKIELKITKKEIQKLDEIRLHSGVLKERQKAGAIYWRTVGETEKQIREITGLSVTTIIRHITKYNELGIEYINENNYKGNTSDLEAFSELIIADFNKQPPKTIAGACGRIEKLTKITRSAARVTVFIKKRAYLQKSVTHQTITVTNDTYITSTEIVTLLEKTREMNKGKKVCIVLDNAKYQKCELVAAAAKKLK